MSRTAPDTRISMCIWGLLCVLGFAMPASALAVHDVDLHKPGYSSHWAFVEERARVFAEPDASSRLVTRLGLLTSDRTSELVLLLRERETADGRTWVQVRLPIRPNNTTGWVSASKLGEYREVHTHLRINRARLTATLIRNGARVFRARIGVGKSYWPTPRGEFYVRSRLNNPGGLYGPLAFGTSARSPVLTDWPGGGVIGIHGTNEPWLLPGRVSHGCIRLRNDQILRLGRLMPIGTPISIS